MPILKAERLHESIREVFQACGVPPGEATIVADHLVAANLRGVDSHGVIRVVQYVDEIRDGQIIPGAPITLVKETEMTAVMDGGWNFGVVVALRGMEVALAKARI